MPRLSAGTRVNRRTKSAELPTAFEPGFIARLDGRTELARALRDRFDSVAADLGGVEELSALKCSLLERLVWLEATLCRIETDLASTNDTKAASETLSRWIQAVNSFTGLCKTLGLERKMRDPWAAIRDSQPPAPMTNDATTVASQPVEASA